MNDWSEAEQRVERAHEFFELGRWDDAESELREALSLNPYQPEWHFNLGLTLDAAGRFEQAAAAFDDAFEHDQTNEQAALMSAAALLRAGKAEAALEQAKRKKEALKTGSKQKAPLQYSPPASSPCRWKE